MARSSPPIQRYTPTNHAAGFHITLGAVADPSCSMALANPSAEARAAIMPASANSCSGSVRKRMARGPNTAARISCAFSNRKNTAPPASVAAAA